ncbi:MAG TPA: DNA polymerase III subunit delta [Gemmata sp.]|jgi:DNA polymerase-3 subunit delta|nr:DNA polymerase III subunit delta [Gemmata sp.]
MDALQLLDLATKLNRHPVYALFGDEDFLKRHAREKLLKLILGDADPDFAVSIYAGDKLDFPTVRNDLDTLPFLAPCRVVVVENADNFVTNHRPTLEQYITKPSSVGVLFLEVKTFPETTKLAKALPDAAKIACKALRSDHLPAWCVAWAKTHHKKKLTQEAAELLVERVGHSMGLLDQELAKVASAISVKSSITAGDVDRLVGRSKSTDVFRIMSAIGEGNPAEALSILEQLFADGEDPMGVLAPLSFQLRKLANVGRLTSMGMPLGPAMDVAQVMKWGNIRVDFEKQLRHLGRRRLEKLSEWLAEINLGLKGGNPLPERVQVERLVVLLARPREDVKT